MNKRKAGHVIAMNSSIQRVVIVLYLLLFSIESKAVIVNVNSISSAGPALTLGPGSYSISPVGPNAGGIYTAWAPNGGLVSGCNAAGLSCSEGWLPDFQILVGSDLTSYRTTAGGGGYGFEYSNPAQALTAMQSGPIYASTNGSAYTLVGNSITISLESSEVVSFHIGDVYYPDNVGGVSLSILPAVPEANTATLLFGGFGLLVLISNRKSRRKPL